MGNKFSKSDTNQLNNATPESDLIKYISDFYKNKYKFLGKYEGTKFSKNVVDDDMIKGMLANTTTYSAGGDANFNKKRACCLKNYYIPMSLPSYDTNLKKVVTTTLQAPIFDNVNELNASNCTFNGDNWINTKADPIYPDFKIPSQQCGNFYQTYCDTVNKNRKIAYPTNSANGPYSPLSEPLETDPYSIINPFYDCNCLNSNFIRNKDFQDISGVTPDMAAQSLDINCLNSVNNGTAFIKSYNRNKQLCINNVNLKNAQINIGENSKLNLDQQMTCKSSITSPSSANDTNTVINAENTSNNSNTNNNTTNNNSGTVNTGTTGPGTTGSGTETTGSGPSTTGSDSGTFSSFVSSNTTLIIIGSVAALIIIILMILLIKSKKRSSDDE
jgi:hypothetical protein